MVCKKLSTSCRVYGRQVFPFESGHRLLVHCSFPWKSEQKKFFQKTLTKKSFTNIKCLKDNRSVCNNFSKKLDDHIIDEPVFDNINTFEKSFSEFIRLACEETIPKTTGSSKITPWINDDLSLLHDEQHLCKEPNRLRELNTSIRKLRNKLKNDYFSDLASNINFASEARAVEEEFRLCKEYRIKVVLHH